MILGDTSRCRCHHHCQVLLSHHYNPPSTPAILARSSHVSSVFRVLGLIPHIFSFSRARVLFLSYFCVRLYHPSVSPLADPAGRFFFGGGGRGQMAEMAPFFPCTAIGVMLKLGSFGVAKWASFFGGGMALNAPPGSASTCPLFIFRLSYA